MPGAPLLVSTRARPRPAVPLIAGNGLLRQASSRRMRILLGTAFKRVEDIVQPHRLQRNVGFPPGVDIDRHQIVLAIDLQAVAGIEHQRDCVRAFRRDLGGEVADLPGSCLFATGRTLSSHRSRNLPAIAPSPWRHWPDWAAASPSDRPTGRSPAPCDFPQMRPRKLRTVRRPAAQRKGCGATSQSPWRP